jgi:uncharacterized membrane protein
VLLPGLLLGVGLGGFVDGILLHQVLQWHHLLTDTGSHPATTVAGLEANTLADGAFHAFAWGCTLAGVLLLARRPRTSLRALTGALLAGWGFFNLVEGLVDHQLLGLHHVRDDLGGPLGWDLGFLAFGVLLVVVGAALVRTSGEPAPKRPQFTA